MSRHLALALIVVGVLSSRADAADPRALAQARHALDNFTHLANALAQGTQRDAEILRHLRSAARSLDDWQKNVAVQKAFDHVTRAEVLARSRPEAVRQAVAVAKEIVEPARQSPTGADLPKLRAELHARPVEQMRSLVAEEMDVLARLSTQIADIASLLTKAVADASSATLGRGE